MTNKHLLTTVILALSFSAASCTQQDQKQLSKDVKSAGEAAKQTATDAVDATKKAADATDLGDKTKKVAGDVAKGAEKAYDAAADATQKAVTAVPRVNRSRFRPFWSSATGWGAFAQTITQGRKQFALSVEYGTLPCRSFRLHWIGSAAAIIVTAAGQAAAHQARAENGYLDVTLANEVILRKGDKIAISA